MGCKKEGGLAVTWRECEDIETLFVLFPVLFRACGGSCEGPNGLQFDLEVERFEVAFEIASDCVFLARGGWDGY